MTYDFSTRYAPAEASRATDSSQPSLLVRIYPVQGLEPPLELATAPILVGRAEHCSLPLSDDSVSRRHATLEHDGGQHFVRDLGSRNGTYVNEQRITSRTLLRGGDRLRFGNQIFKYLSADGIETQYHEVMFKLMTTDGLTSVYNKRFFLESLERELAQAQRDQACLSLMLLDLDKFKSINDTYGHLAGDAVLVEFARRVKTLLRSGELFARYGGEEFVWLAPRATLLEACAAAERIRAAVAAEPMRFEAKLLPVTVSIGVHCCENTREATAQELLQVADEKLYRAKNSGRNQVQS